MLAFVRNYQYEGFVLPWCKFTTPYYSCNKLDQAFEQPREFEVTDVPIPEISHDEVLIKGSLITAVEKQSAD